MIRARLTSLMLVLSLALMPAKTMAMAYLCTISGQVLSHCCCSGAPADSPEISASGTAGDGCCEMTIQSDERPPASFSASITPDAPPLVAASSKPPLPTWPVAASTLRYTVRPRGPPPPPASPIFLLNCAFLN